MQRFFLSLIVLTALTINQFTRASIADETKASLKSNKSLPKKSLQITKSSERNNNLILVPPPPPEQPSFLDWHEMSILPDSLGFLNEDELKNRLTRLRKEIEYAQENSIGNDQEISEAKEKAERFKILYTEGVVSRKELEAAQKNVPDKEYAFQEAKGKLEDLKVQENAILKRLDNLKKNHKNKSASKKKSSR